MNIKNLDSNFGHVFYVDAFLTDNDTYANQAFFETDATSYEVADYVFNMLKSGYVGLFYVGMLRLLPLYGIEAVDDNTVKINSVSGSTNLTKYTVNDRTFWGVRAAVQP